MPTGYTIFLECPCGLNRGIPLHEFNYENDITQCKDKHVVINCPDCTTTRKSIDFSRIIKDNEDEDDKVWWRIVLDEEHPPTDGKNPFPHLQPDTNESPSDPKSPPERSQLEEPPICPRCDDQIPLEEYHEDEHAPEVGWKYWHCPECETNYRDDFLTDIDA